MASAIVTFLPQDNHRLQPTESVNKFSLGLLNLLKEPAPRFWESFTTGEVQQALDTFLRFAQCAHPLIINCYVQQKWLV